MTVNKYKSENKEKTGSGLYIHIPFCKQACTYCDFYFETSLKHRDGFTNQLILEIKHYGNSAFSDDIFDTIYLGGGTPSRLTIEELHKITEQIRKSFKIAQNAEFTIEANPDDITKTYLNELKSVGINRLSIGIQSFNSNILEFMNRAHTVNEAIKALEYIRDTDFQSWTADLIYGNTEQSIENLEKDISILLRYNPPHVSAYSLTVEPHTKLGSLVRKKLVSPLPDEKVARHMEIVTERLADAGIMRYEVSNYSRTGHQSKHNSAYWTHKNYLGLGPSAHSFRWNDDGNIGGKRWRNKPRMIDYMTGNIDIHTDESEDLDKVKLVEERLMTGLRTVDGIPFDELKYRYGFEFSDRQLKKISEFEQRKLVGTTKNTLCLTSSGFKIADFITLEIIAAG